MSETTRPQAPDLFATVDTMDIPATLSLFASGSRVVFGNGDPLHGIDEIRSGINASHATLAGLHHAIATQRSRGAEPIVQFKDSYDRKDGHQDTIPCVTNFHT